jgi:putative tricarboxylic transport membrane protein
MRDFLTIRTVEIVVCLLLLALSVRVMMEGVRLGAGWSERGPQSGFFPFSLALIMAAGLVGALLVAWRERATRPFFEAPEEWIDLLKVGVPAGLAIALTPTLGLYITSGSTFSPSWPGTGGFPGHSRSWAGFWCRPGFIYCCATASTSPCR